MRSVGTAAEFLGKVTLVLTSQLTLNDDVCCRCRRRLSDLYAIYLADCGRYCSRGCADEHADLIAAASAVTAFERGAIASERLFQAGLIHPRPDDDDY
jgi:hypothetical protein